jgi:hypothetical protein
MKLRSSSRSRTDQLVAVKFFNKPLLLTGRKATSYRS